MPQRSTRAAIARRIDWHPNNQLLACGATDFRARCASASVVLPRCPSRSLVCPSLLVHSSLCLVHTDYLLRTVFARVCVILFYSRRAARRVYNAYMKEVDGKAMAETSWGTGADVKAADDDGGAEEKRSSSKPAKAGFGTLVAEFNNSYGVPSSSSLPRPLPFPCLDRKSVV